MKKISIVSSLLILGCWGSFLFGQSSLSLQEALDLTLANNYGIRIADMNSEIAENNNTWGAVGRLPRIDFNVNGSGFKSANPGSFVPQRINAGASPSITWTVFDGYRMEANKARLTELQDLSLGNAALVVENNLQAVILSYYQTLLAQEQLNVLTEVLDNSTERLSYETYKKELGTSGSFDLLQFKNAVLTDSANVLSQKLALNTSMRNLKLLMGVAHEMNFSLGDPLKETFDELDWDPLLEKMLADNNNMKNQYINSNILREELRIARGALMPTVSLNLGTTYSVGQIQRLTQDGVANINVSAFDYSAGISIAFNIYNGGNTRRLIENAEINQVIGKLQEEELVRSLKNDLFEIYDQYESRRALLGIQLDNVENSRQSLEMSKDRFQNGLINSIDYRNIQLQYLNAQFSKFQALRNLKESETELIRLTGGLIRE